MKRILGITALTGIAVVVMCLAAYAGTYTVTRLTDDSYLKSPPQLNDSGQVVWRGNPGALFDENGQYIGRKHDIFLYDGTAIIQLTDNPINYFVGEPQIDNSGQVLWTGRTASIMEDGQYVGYKEDVFLYNGTAITQLTDNPVNKYGVGEHQLNNSGQVLWTFGTGTIVEDGHWIGIKRDIFLYNGTAITQLMDDSYDDLNAQLNNSGQVAWTGGEGLLWEGNA